MAGSKARKWCSGKQPERRSQHAVVEKSLGKEKKGCDLVFAWLQVTV